MPEETFDPSANTQAFQAWVDQGHAQPAEPARSKLPLIIGIAVAAVVIIALLLFLALG